MQQFNRPPRNTNNQQNNVTFQQNNQGMQQGMQNQYQRQGNNRNRNNNQVNNQGGMNFPHNLNFHQGGMSNQFSSDGNNSASTESIQAQYVNYLVSADSNANDTDMADEDITDNANEDTYEVNADEDESIQVPKTIFERCIDENLSLTYELGSVPISF